MLSYRESRLYQEPKVSVTLFEGEVEEWKCRVRRRVCEVIVVVLYNLVYLNQSFVYSRLADAEYFIWEGISVRSSGTTTRSADQENSEFR